MKGYEIIDHTADVGIRVEGKDLKEIFTKTASAMFDIIAEEKTDTKYQRPDKILVKQKAENLEELFINWLNELLSLSATKELIFSDFKIDQLNQNFLSAEVTGFDVKNYKVNVEIKAATYHELKIERKDFGYQAQVIFDV